MVKNLKMLRQKHNISQQKLASIIGISQQSINKYENQNTEPDIDTLIKLAEYFNTSIDYLVGYTDQEGLPLNLKNTKIINKDELNIVKTYRVLENDKKHIIKAVINSYTPRSSEDEDHDS